MFSGTGFLSSFILKFIDMKKISAAFDGLKFAQSTLDYATDLAAKGETLLTGVFLEDFLYHSFNLFDMVGSQGISQAKLKLLLDKDKETRKEAVRHFEVNCQNKQLSYAVHQDGNFAITDLLRESIYSDLVIIEAAETFNHFHLDRPTSFVKELLGGSQSPVLVVPAVYCPIEKIVILYDGGPSAVFAIKLFNYLLPWLRKLPVEIVFAREGTASKELPDDVLIKEFISCHYPEATYTFLKGEPETVLPAHLKKLSSNCLVVMGAYSRGAVSRLFKSSMADQLIAAVDVPVFIAHHR